MRWIQPAGSKYCQLVIRLILCTLFSHITFMESRFACFKNLAAKSPIPISLEVEDDFLVVVNTITMIPSYLIKRSVETCLNVLPGEHFGFLMFLFRKQSKQLRAKLDTIMAVVA